MDVGVCVPCGCAALNRAARYLGGWLQVLGAARAPPGRVTTGASWHVSPSGNTALLLTLCVQHSFPEPSRLYLDLILAILAVELVCSLTCQLIYAVRIRKFNKAKPQPDILEEEKIYAYPSNIKSETGFRTVSSLEEIVEKQGDIIVYLKRHNALLSKRLLAFTSSDLGSQSQRRWKAQGRDSNCRGTQSNLRLITWQAAIGSCSFCQVTFYNLYWKPEFGS